MAYNWLRMAVQFMLWNHSKYIVYLVVPGAEEYWKWISVLVITFELPVYTLIPIVNGWIEVFVRVRAMNILYEDWILYASIWEAEQYVKL